MDKENKWKCLKCKQIFSDTERERENDDRCPKCKVAFSQIPYEAPHEISDYELLTPTMAKGENNP